MPATVSSVPHPPAKSRAPTGPAEGPRSTWGCYCISAIRLFGGQPLRVAAEHVINATDGADGGDLRLAATLAIPDDVLARIIQVRPRRDPTSTICGVAR
jgi:hypothetical protein